MYFITWLFEQIDLGSPSSQFAKICWDDINNGCASIRFNSQAWMDHFNSKHKDKSEILIEMLFRAYVEYRKETKTKL